jgi:dimethylamine monooxygenase subunit A
MPLSLQEIFPDEDYRFRLTLRRGDIAAFFAKPEPSILAERGDWLKIDCSRYASGAEGCLPLLAEFEAMAGEWIDSPIHDTAGASIGTRLSTLGLALEPDFLLLSADGTGQMRLRAGVVCFPSSWALEDKMGRTLDDIHGPVPGLNGTLSPPISQFLGRLKPEAPYERANWGLAATPEHNMHPALRRPRILAPLDYSKTWIRIEDQIFAVMPETGGIIFGIRLRIISLMAVINDATLEKGLRRALATMSDALIAYKGLGVVRDSLGSR